MKHVQYFDVDMTIIEAHTRSISRGKGYQVTGIINQICRYPLRHHPIDSNTCRINNFK
jgi:hypothetical protein